MVTVSWAVGVVPVQVAPAGSIHTTGGWPARHSASVGAHWAAAREGSAKASRSAAGRSGRSERPRRAAPSAPGGRGRADDGAYPGAGESEGPRGAGLRRIVVVIWSLNGE